MDESNRNRSRGWNDPPVSLFTNKKPGKKQLNYRYRVGHDCINGTSHNGNVTVRNTADGSFYHHPSPSCPEFTQDSREFPETRDAISQPDSNYTNANLDIFNTIGRINIYLQNCGFFNLVQSADIKQWLKDIQTFLSLDRKSYYISYIDNFMNNLETKQFDNIPFLLKGMTSWNQPWTHLFNLMSGSRNYNALTT
ncbi:hypothetical protein HZS_6361 [Henneguya salminicola]|nr:hypothetical protein HZS_6361 [Henneguya salminicola]